METLENNLTIDGAPAQSSAAPNDLQLAISDVLNGVFKKCGLWSYLGIAEMRRRYKRTMIGPFWTSLSLGVFICSMGYMLSAAWHTSPKEFLPYFCSGYICWMLIQSILAEGCTTFTAPGSFVKQISLPYTVYACLLTWRNVIVLFHHLIILVLVLWFAGIKPNANFLLFIPGLTIVFLTSVWVATLLGMGCSRFRDIQQIVTSLLQLSMFITPIMWKPEQLGRQGTIVADLNPLYHFVSIIRLPLIGEAPSALNWIWSISLFAVGACITTYLLGKNYRRLVFWL